MSLQVRYGDLFEQKKSLKKYRQLIPQKISRTGLGFQSTAPSFFWKKWSPDFHLAVACFVAKSEHPHSSNWEGIAFFEIIRALKEIHGSALYTAKEEILQSIATAQSTFGWLYQD